MTLKDISFNNTPLLLFSPCMCLFCVPARTLLLAAVSEIVAEIVTWCHTRTFKRENVRT